MASDKTIRQRDALARQTAEASGRRRMKERLGNLRGLEQQRTHDATWRAEQERMNAEQERVNREWKRVQRSAARRKQSHSPGPRG